MDTIENKVKSIETELTPKQTIDVELPTNISLLSKKYLEKVKAILEEFNEVVTDSNSKVESANKLSGEAIDIANTIKLFMQHLTESIDTSEANKVGIANVEFVTDGEFKKFKFSNLKGEKGERGATGDKGEKGDTGEGFSIYRTYESIEQMEADVSNIEEGRFVLISSNVEDEDNAKLFVRGKTKFNYLIDLSGAKGIRGEKGDKGDKGDTGDKGEKGDNGEKGNTGATGATGAQGEQGFGYVANVERATFTEANWSTYGTIGHIENWSNTENIRNNCRIGDLFTVTGTATDSGNAHQLTYRSSAASGNLYGQCIAHLTALRGKQGEKGESGGGDYLQLSGGTITGNLTVDGQTTLQNAPLNITGTNRFINGYSPTHYQSLTLRTMDSDANYILEEYEGSQSRLYWVLRRKSDDGNVGIFYLPVFQGTKTLATVDQITNTPGTVHVKGKLVVDPSYDTTNNSYNEGIRINTGSNGWAEVLFGAPKDSTASEQSDAWICGKRGEVSGAAEIGDFTIAYGGAGDDGLTLHKDGSAPTWKGKPLGGGLGLANWNCSQTSGGDLEFSYHS